MFGVLWKKSDYRVSERCRKQQPKWLLLLYGGRVTCSGFFTDQFQPAWEQAACAASYTSWEATGALHGARGCSSVYPGVSLKQRYGAAWSAAVKSLHKSKWPKLRLCGPGMWVRIWPTPLSRPACHGVTLPLACSTYICCCKFML